MNRPSACLLLCGLLLSSGCATAYSKRLDALRQGLDEVSFEQPLDQAWQQARLLLAERDFPMIGEDAKAVGQSWNGLDVAFSPAHETSNEDYDSSTFQALSSSRVSKDKQWLDTGWNFYRVRYHVEGQRLVDGGSRVRFFRIKQDMASGGFTQRERDVEFELELARRVDPEVARQLEQRIEAALK